MADQTARISLLKIFFILFLTVVPGISLACSPPPQKMTIDQMQDWTEANPCFGIDVDEVKYKFLRKSCIMDKIKNRNMSFEDFVKTPPPGDDTISSCNHYAYKNSEL